MLVLVVLFKFSLSKNRLYLSVRYMIWSLIHWPYKGSHTSFAYLYVDIDTSTRPTDISVIKRLESVLDIASRARINVDLIYLTVHNHPDRSAWQAHILIESIIVLIDVLKYNLLSSIKNRYYRESRNIKFP